MQLVIFQTTLCIAQITVINLKAGKNVKPGVKPLHEQHFMNLMSLRSFRETIKQHHFVWQKTTTRNDEIWDESATREKLKHRKRKVFVSHVSQVKLFLLPRRYQKRGIKIAHFFSSRFVGFCPPPKMHHALWILNSNHYASATDGKHRNRDLLRLISRNVKCLLWPYMVFASPLLLLFSLKSRTSQQTVHGEAALQQKTEYFHYVLQNITHSVFAACTNSRNVDFARVVNFGIANIFTTPLTPPVLSIDIFSSRSECLFAMLFVLLWNISLSWKQE